MNAHFIYFFLTFFLLYGAANFYTGLRIRQALNPVIPTGYGHIYWAVLIALAASYIAGAAGRRYFPDTLSESLLLAGSYWLAVTFYSVLVFLLFDLVRLSGRIFGFLPLKTQQNPALTGMAALFLIAAIVAYGFWNARSPRVVHYDVEVNKAVPGMDRLHAVVVSDIHLGRIVHSGRLAGLVEIINGQEPDLVLLPGDIIEEVSVFKRQGMADILRRIRSTRGVYAVPGNHEYIGGHPQEAFSLLEEAGVTVLMDRYVQVAGGIYVAGRDDRSGARYTGRPRKELAAVLEGIDRSRPVILLDHQPLKLGEAAQNGVDLQVSGHTHQGQLFPNNFITRRIFEIDWGYLRKGDCNVIVSTGFGTWGPPIRVGNRPEIVDITIHFNSPER